MSRPLAGGVPQARGPGGLLTQRECIGESRLAGVPGRLSLGIVPRIQASEGQRPRRACGVTRLYTGRGFL